MTPTTQELFDGINIMTKKVQNLEEKKNKLKGKVKEIEESEKFFSRSKLDLIGWFENELVEDLGSYLFGGEYKASGPHHHDGYIWIGNHGYDLLVYPNLEIRLVDKAKSDIGLCCCFKPNYWTQEIIHSDKIDFKNIQDEKRLGRIYKNFSNALNRYEFNQGNLSERALYYVGKFWDTVERGNKNEKEILRRFGGSDK
ncbi:MAG: hypothetical protein JSV92_03715 [archaeon]|nr:MAG: hypothetical protein JSV92_03715 [archaeon]